MTFLMRRGVLQAHASGTAPDVIRGTCKPQPVTRFATPGTGLTAMRDGQGGFVSGWKLNPAQLNNVLTRGSL